MVPGDHPRRCGGHSGVGRGVRLMGQRRGIGHLPGVAVVRVVLVAQAAGAAARQHRPRSGYRRAHLGEAGRLTAYFRAPGHDPFLAARTVIEAACSAPAVSLVPFAARHSPWLIAWAFAATRLAYRVSFVTDTEVCAAVPAVVSVSVLPLAEPTAP